MYHFPARLWIVVWSTRRRRSWGGCWTRWPRSAQTKWVFMTGEYFQFRIRNTENEILTSPIPHSTSFWEKRITSPFRSNVPWSDAFFDMSFPLPLWWLASPCRCWSSPRPSASAMIWPGICDGMGKRNHYFVYLSLKFDRTQYKRFNFGRYEAMCIHGDKKQEERDWVLKEFRLISVFHCFSWSKSIQTIWIRKISKCASALHLVLLLIITQIWEVSNLGSYRCCSKRPWCVYLGSPAGLLISCKALCMFPFHF